MATSMLEATATREVTPMRTRVAPIGARYFLRSQITKRGRQDRERSCPARCLPRAGKYDQPRSSKAACAAFSCASERWRISTPQNSVSLRFRHSQLDSRLKRGWIGRHHAPQRRRSGDQRDGAAAKSRLGAHHGLHQKVGNMNASKSHRIRLATKECVLGIACDIFTLRSFGYPCRIASG